MFYETQQVATLLITYAVPQGVLQRATLAALWQTRLIVTQGLTR